MPSAMDMCNIPELLALDLESGESIFAAKRMTAGAPRSSTFIFDTEGLRDARAEEDRSKDVVADAYAYPLYGETMGGLEDGTLEDNLSTFTYSKFEDNGTYTDNDSDSLDSFDLPIVSLSPRRGNRSRQEDADADDVDADDTHSDSSSVSSFSFTVSSVRRQRHQSVATAATSVISSACRSSGHSHILSAIGPSAGLSSPRTSFGEGVSQRVSAIDYTAGMDMDADKTITTTTHTPQTSWLDFGGSDSDSDSELDDAASTQPSSMETIPETAAEEISLPSPPAYYLPPLRRHSLGRQMTTTTTTTKEPIFASEDEDSSAFTRRPLRRFSSQTLRASATAPSLSVSQTTLRRAYSHKEDRRDTSRSRATKSVLLDGYGNDLYTVEQPLADLSLLRSQFDNKTVASEAKADSSDSLESIESGDNASGQIMTATAMPVSKPVPVPRSLYSVRSSRRSVVIEVPETEEEKELTVTEPERPISASSSPTLLPPAPLLAQRTPSIVAIPLPKEVVDMLRVSVSCFPETMLSLSSFSIQTIRSYSRKIRRGGSNDDYYGEEDMDSDSNFRRMLLSPSSPLASSFHQASSSGCPHPPASPLSTTSATAPSLTTTPSQPSSSWMSSSRRFWKLPRRLLTSRTSPNLRAEAAFSGPPPATPTTPTTPTAIPSALRTPLSRSNSNRSSRLMFLQKRMGGSGRASLASSHGQQQDFQESSKSNGGACFRAIFPLGTDLLCDALYAHIIAYNYVSLLCPAVETTDSREVVEEDDDEDDEDDEWLLLSGIKKGTGHVAASNNAQGISRKAASLLGISGWEISQMNASEFPPRTPHSERQTQSRSGQTFDSTAPRAQKPSVSPLSDLHTGLAGCISQLVSTLKTADREHTLAQQEDQFSETQAPAHDIDPLFMRTLCELVRSQEEQL